MIWQEACSVSDLTLGVSSMLEFSNFQIFMMVLHGCLLMFAFAYLFGGNTSRQRNKKVVSYKEFQRKKARHSTTNPMPSQVRTVSQAPMRDVSEVGEITEVFDLVAGDSYQSAQPTRLLSSAQTVADTVTDFALEDLLDYDFDID